jgi:hypothetical protein
MAFRPFPAGGVPEFHPIFQIYGINVPPLNLTLIFQFYRIKVPPYNIGEGGLTPIFQIYGIKVPPPILYIIRISLLG